ncbi:hypothetical protein GPDM_07280 [Planococcus donghaensis MPA1U2]|uniref:Uncharacterized protein n=1 Tax=Planococcus donghaensis MPA1U2 TaxID=933115 RepID=E7RG58_9BACL|nr:hypothetical protein GPDM_07280 [Planococcus donghaensis MPA1U2]
MIRVGRLLGGGICAVLEKYARCGECYARCWKNTRGREKLTRVPEKIRANEVPDAKRSHSKVEVACS